MGPERDPEPRFPRIDNAYLKKGSLAFDEQLTNLWQNIAPDCNESSQKRRLWIGFALVGILVGFCGMFIVIMEEYVEELINESMYKTAEIYASDNVF